MGDASSLAVPVDPLTAALRVANSWGTDLRLRLGDGELVVDAVDAAHIAYLEATITTDAQGDGEGLVDAADLLHVLDATTPDAFAHLVMGDDDLKVQEGAREARIGVEDTSGWREPDPTLPDPTHAYTVGLPDLLGLLSAGKRFSDATVFMGDGSGLTVRCGDEDEQWIRDRFEDDTDASETATARYSLDYLVPGLDALTDASPNPVEVGFKQDHVLQVQAQDDDHDILFVLAPRIKR